MPVFGLKMGVLVLGGRECFKIIKKSVEKYFSFLKKCFSFLQKSSRFWHFLRLFRVITALSNLSARTRCTPVRLRAADKLRLVLTRNSAQKGI